MVALITINIPLLFGLVKPLHDTNYVFDVFYFFYNEFFFHNELPGWEPLGRYGVQSYFLFISSLSMSNIFAGFLGWVLRVEDAMLVFKLSLLLEQLMYLFGVYLLSKRLFKHKTTVAFVCLTSIMSVTLMLQINWDIRIFSMLPLLMYFILRFFSEMSPRHIAVASFLLGISGIGLSYLSVIGALVVCVFVLTLLPAYGRRLSGLLGAGGKETLLGMAILASAVIVMSLYYYFFIDSTRLIETLTEGRAPASNKTELRYFLTYGGGYGLLKFANLFIPSPLLSFLPPEFNIYFGLIPLIFIFYALIKPEILTSTALAAAATAWGIWTARHVSSANFIFEYFGAWVKWLLPLMTAFFVVYVYRKRKNPYLAAITAVVGVIGLLSLGKGTIVAELLYRYFPLMDYVKYVGYTVFTFKFFLPLIAGFGLDGFLGGSGDDKRRLKQAEAAVLIFLVAGAFIYHYFSKYAQVPRVGIPYLIAVLLPSAALFRYRGRLTPQGHLKIFILAAVCLQMLSYQALVTYRFSIESKKMSLGKGAALVNRYDFQEMRTVFPLTARSKRLAASIPMSTSTIANYSEAYGFIQWDPCFTQFSTLYANSHVVEFIRLRGGVSDATEIKKKLGLGFEVPVAPVLAPNPNDIVGLRSLGCTAPKLRLISKPVYAASYEEAVSLIKSPDIDASPVLYDFPDEAGHVDGQASGSVSVTGYKANELTLDAKVAGGGGAWLYYADAWHPDWKAFVNGRPTRIARANLAFKAIWLPEGASRVRFVFDSPFARRCSYFFSVLGIAFIAAMLVGICRTVFQRRTFRRTTNSAKV